MPAAPAELVPQEGGADAGKEQGANPGGLVFVLKMRGLALHLYSKAEGPQGVHVDPGQPVTERIIGEAAEMGLLATQGHEPMAQNAGGVVVLAEFACQMEKGQAVVERAQGASGGILVETAVEQAHAIA